MNSILIILEKEMARLNEQRSVSQEIISNPGTITPDEYNYAVGALAAYDDALYGLRRIHKVVFREVEEITKLLEESES